MYSSKVSPSEFLYKLSSAKKYFNILKLHKTSYSVQSKSDGISLKDLEVLSHCYQDHYDADDESIDILKADDATFTEKLMSLNFRIDDNFVAELEKLKKISEDEEASNFTPLSSPPLGKRYYHIVV